MSIYSYDFYHGAVLNRLLDFGKSIEIQTFPSDSNSSFTINQNTGIFLKYSEKRISPWRFTFKKNHQEEIQHIRDLHKNVFIIFVCYDDGFACLSWEEYKKILDDHHDEFEWISISRVRGGKYNLGGSNGRLKHRIGKKDFPNKIFKVLK